MVDPTDHTSYNTENLYNVIREEIKELFRSLGNSIEERIPNVETKVDILQEKVDKINSRISLSNLTSSVQTIASEQQQGANGSGYMSPETAESDDTFSAYVEQTNSYRIASSNGRRCVQSWIGHNSEVSTL